MTSKSIAIVGGGLTGPVLAICLAKHGYRVTIFERHPDPRGAPAKRGKSINITLCTRGFAGLERAGLAEVVRQLCVPASARYIHNVDGTRDLQPYGNRGEALFSVSRDLLNRTLLDHASKTPGVDVRFGVNCVHCDLDLGQLTFKQANGGSTVEVTADHVIATDGARSFVRRQLQNRDRFNFSQLYSPHGNKELPIPLGSSAGWFQHKNALHIWPRGEYMLIAFPNPDGSFTSTLHLPLEGPVSFDSIQTDDDLLALFKTSFPDALAEMPDVVSHYFANPTIPMVTIRCSPWRYKDKLLLAGDAAHGVWPSYGQGANAGFEDCLILDQCLDQHGDDWSLATAAYEQQRKPDVDAVADLSEEHFREIRDKVGDPSFLLRKRVERKINEMYPDKYIPLYSLVAFTTTPYARAVEVEREQRKMIDALLAGPNVETLLTTGEIEGKIRALMES